MSITDNEAYFGVVDFIIFVGLLVVSAVIGAYFAYKDRNDNTTDSYYFGDRKMSPLPVAMSMAVSFVSAITVIGFPVEVYLYGTVFFWIIPAVCCAAIFASIYFIPLIHRLSLPTIYQYLEMRYSKAVRSWCSGIVILEMIIYMGITVYLPALALNAVTPLHLNWTIALTSLICTFYTSVGGMKAVIWTDVIQGIIMIFGSLALFIKTVGIIGGLENLVEAVNRGERNSFASFNPDPRMRSTAFTMLGGMIINACVSSCCTQVYSQRFLSCKSAKDATIANFLRLIPVSLFMLLAGANGLAMYAYYEGCDPTEANIIDKQDQTTPRMAVEVFRDMPGMSGLFVSAAYSGTLSTVSSGVNALAAMALEDFINPIWPKLTNTKRTLISKALSVLFGVLVMAMAYVTSLLEATVIQISMTMAGIIGGPILTVYIMGVFFPWINSKGALAGLLVGWTTSSWVSVAAIIHKPGEQFRETLPLSTESCNFTSYQGNISLGLNSSASNYDGSSYMRFTTVLDETTITSDRPVLYDTLYSISPFVYGIFGFTIGCFVSIIVTLITGKNKASEADPALFVPIIDNEKIFPKCVIRFFRFGVPVRFDRIPGEMKNLGEDEFGNKMEENDRSEGEGGTNEIFLEQNENRTNGHYSF